ncbi:unnamed protein product [Clonostachys rosea]|uniref:Uncharacterized protein n=1 Tax=Bionectria ochroleuca TaxID=29856 RepID=A0ABY6UJY6_BIOOC|nr:unnamed protein product [Clonostachys rosea]
MGYIPGVQNVQSLLKVHSRAKGLVARACEDGASQLRLRVVPLPERAELNCRFHRQAIAVLGAIDCDQENVFSWKGYKTVLDMRSIESSSITYDLVQLPSPALGLNEVLGLSRAPTTVKP